MKRIRATAVVIKDGKILMIHRLCDGYEYYVFPGGTVEEGEVPEVGVLRELKEETNADGKLIEKIFQFIDTDETDHQLFLCDYISGDIGLTKGSVEDLKTTENNTYEPMWVDVNKIPTLDIWPKKVKEFLVQYFILK